MPATRIIIVGLCALAIAMGIGRFVYTPLLPLMHEDGILTISDGGLLASLHFLGYWLGALLAAGLPAAPKTVMRGSLLTIALCTLGMGLTDNFVLWSVLRLLAGICSAFILVLISNFYIKHLTEIGREETHGWVFSGVGAGIVFAGLGTLLLMIFQIDSAHSWLNFGALTLLAASVISLNIGPEMPDGKTHAARGKSHRTPLIWSLLLPYGALGLTYVIPATYLPVMAQEIVPSPLVFGWAWPVFGATAFLSTILASRWQRRYTVRQIWIASQLVMALGLLLPAIYPHISTIIIAGVTVGGTFMIITMMGMKETHRVAPAHDVLRHLAAMTAAFASGQVIGPVFAGWIHAQTNSFSAALIFASVLLTASLLMLVVKTPRDKTAKT